MTLQAAEGDAVNFGNADIKRLEDWQQMWLVMKIAAPTSSIDVTIYVDAVAGSEFFFTGAQVENGPVPSEALQPSGVPVWSKQVAPVEPLGATKTFRQRSRAAAQLKEADRSAQALLLKGDALMRARCFEEADIVLAAGAILWPWKAEFYSHRGLCAEMSGDARAAADCWRELIRIFPHIAMGYHRLASALRTSGVVSEAVSIIEAALVDHANDPAVVIEAARTYEAASRQGDALTLWDKVIVEHGNRADWLAERERLRQAAASAVVAE